MGVCDTTEGQYYTLHSSIFLCTYQSQVEVEAPVLEGELIYIAIVRTGHRVDINGGSINTLLLNSVDNLF